MLRWVIVGYVLAAGAVDNELAQAIVVLARARQHAVWDRATAHNNAATKAAHLAQVRE